MSWPPVAAMLLAAAPIAPPAAAQAGKPFEVRALPTGAWSVDFAAERCVALRQYDAGGKPVIVALEPEPDRPDVKVTLRLPDDPVLERRLVVDRGVGRLLINAKEVSTTLLAGRAAEAGILLIGAYRGNAPGAVPLEQLTSVEMHSASIDARLPLPGMAKLAPVLARCNRSLLESFGLSAADQERQASWPRAKAAMGSYVKSEDYPEAAIRRGQSGRVLVRFWVSAEGVPTSCTVRQSSGSAILDKASCDLLLRRARFEPARDRDGAAMAAPAFEQLRWITFR